MTSRDAVAKKVLQQQAEDPTKYYQLLGYVGGITSWTSQGGGAPSEVIVSVLASGDQPSRPDFENHPIGLFAFPPNDRAYLAEFQRAQDHHFLVSVHWVLPPKGDPLILEVSVATFT